MDTVELITQAGRLLANLIVAGGGILIRAAAQAYKQAIVSKFPDLPEQHCRWDFAMCIRKLLVCYVAAWNKSDGERFLCRRTEVWCHSRIRESSN